MNYYNTLGVNKSATQSDIKKAYRKLASKHHPDKGGDEHQFRLIQEAYDVLGDEQKRREYDNPQPQFRFDTHGFGEPFGDAFNDFFRQANAQGRAYQARNPDAIVDIQVSLQDAYTGKDVVVDTGISREVIAVPAGVQDGTRLRVHGKGYSRYKDTQPGDLIVRIYIDYPHDISRKGDDIYQRLNISALQAITGAEIEFNHFSGKKIKIKVPKGSQPGSKLRLSGWGMKNQLNHYKGNLYVIINVTIPNITNEEHLEQLKKIQTEVY